MFEQSFNPWAISALNKGFFGDLYNNPPVQSKITVAVYLVRVGFELSPLLLHQSSSHYM